MASLVLADRVKESTAATGTGAVGLGGAAPGYQTFAAAIGDGNSCHYVIADPAGPNWEVGIGTYSAAGNSLSRDTILASSNGGALVSFAAGPKDVFADLPAAAVSAASSQYNVKAFGARGDGVTDDTAAVQDAINAAANGAGGTVFFPPATYLILGQLTVPNDGGSPPTQRNLRVVGSGAHASGTGTAQRGGTVLDLRYSGGGVAKFKTLGLGLLEVEGITFVDGGSANGTPFLWTTNTTLHVRDCAFLGTGTGTACLQDAIVLGGNTSNIDGTDTAAFQGYGTVIEANYFNNIRRGVYGQSLVNGVVIRDNCWWNGCGGTTTAAAIELAGFSNTQRNSGNLISGNLIESSNYPYCLRLQNAQCNCILGNSYFDPTATTLAYIRFESLGQFNLVVHGWHDDSKPDVSDASGTSNTILTGHQSQISTFAQQLQLTGAGSTRLSLVNSVAGSVIGPAMLDSTGGKWDWSARYGSSGNGFADWFARFSVPQRSVSDAVTNGTTTLTSATANFSAATDTGAEVSGTNIPASTTIASVTNSTTVVLSAAASGSSGAGSLTIGGVTEQMFNLQRASATESRFRLLGSTLSRIQQPNGDLRIESKAGNTLWLGDSSNNCQVTNGIVTVSKGLATSKVTLTYGTTISVAGQAGYNLLTVTDTSAFTISNPSAAANGQVLTIEITNSSGGAMGTATWASGYVLTGGAWANPASTKRRSITFAYNGSNWIEQYRAANDF